MKLHAQNINLERFLSSANQINASVYLHYSFPSKHENHRCRITPALLPNSFCKATHTSCPLISDTLCLIKVSSASVKGPILLTVDSILFHFRTHSTGAFFRIFPMVFQSVISCVTPFLRFFSIGWGTTLLCSATRSASSVPAKIMHLLLVEKDKAPSAYNKPRCWSNEWCRG